MDFKEEKKSVEEAVKKMSTQASTQDTELSRKEAEDYDLEAKRALVLSTFQNIEERKRYAFLIFLMVVGWLFSIVGIIILCGLSLLNISDGVLLGLIGATTVNVTTFFVIVTKYLFPSTSGVK